MGKLNIRTLALVAMVAAGITGANAQQADIPEAIKNDLANASPDIRWPTGFEPGASPIFAHNEIVLRSSCEVVWQRLVAVEDWPNWYRHASDTHIVGAKQLGAGGTFTWRVFGRLFTAKLDVFEPNRRLYWYGKGAESDARTYHTWLLAKAPTGCKVVTEEVSIGASSVVFRARNPDGLHRAHDEWLDQLRAVTEGSQSKAVQR